MSKNKRLPSVMAHQFSTVPNANIPRSQFNRSCGCKTTFDAGYLVPVFIDEVLPGDTFNMNMNAFARLATPIAPVMDNLYMDSFFFAVPVRLLWDNFQKFMGEQTDPGDSIDYLVPKMVSPAGGYSAETLSDYLGLPTGVAGVNHSSLWHRAYNLIWNEWFRDENLQDSVTVDKGDGPDDPANYVLLRRGKRHDYFTSCLPWPQKGDSVDLPLGTTASVVTDSTIPTAHTSLDATIRQFAAGQQDLARLAGLNTGGVGTVVWDNTGMQADLSTATAATINQLRTSFQIQKLLERDARGGTRYTEVIRSHFGVISPDARLQRPEYLGGGSTPVNINPIAQTSESGSTPQGNLSAMGTVNLQGHGFVKSFTEHCVVIGMVSVRADLNYQQGLDRMMFKFDRYSFYWPALSHIGEQPVYNTEIYTQGTAGGAADFEVFGYQERYAEYRYKQSKITGKMRSTYAQPLDMWHLAQEFGSLPTLNSTFIQETPPVDRVIAVPSEPHFLFDAYFNLRCARPMPVRSVPGLIDHF